MVVDIADLQTKLAVRPDKRIESVTTVRYKVKNTTGQFLALTMPAEARVWAVSQIEPGPDGRRTIDSPGGVPRSGQRATADSAAPPGQSQRSGDHRAGVRPGAREQRMVETHGGPRRASLHRAHRLCRLAGHRSGPLGGHPGRRQHAGSSLGHRVVRAWRLWPSGSLRLWERALDRALDESRRSGRFAGAMAILIAILAAFRRRRVPDLIVLTVLVLALWIGIEAAMGQMARPEPLTVLNCAQAVNADPDQALQRECGSGPRLASGCPGLRCRWGNCRHHRRSGPDRWTAFAQGRSGGCGGGAALSGREDAGHVACAQGPDDMAGARRGGTLWFVYRSWRASASWSPQRPWP